MRKAYFLFLIFTFAQALYGNCYENTRFEERFSLSINQQTLFRTTHPGNPSIPIIQKDNTPPNLNPPLVTNLDLLCGPDLIYRKKSDSYLELCAQFLPRSDTAWEVCYLWPHKVQSETRAFHEQSLSLVLSLQNQTTLKNINKDNTDYLKAQDAALSYESSFYLLQLQHWKLLFSLRSSYLTVGYGLGLMQVTLDDDLLLSFAKQKIKQRLPSSSHATYSGRNNLWGPQIGLSFKIQPCTYSHWGIKARFGTLVRHTTFTASLFDKNDTYLVTSNTLHSAGVSFLGHVEAFWTYFFSDAFNVSWGYQGYSLFRIPFVVNQTNRTLALEIEQAPLSREQSLFLNGLFFGSSLSF